MLKNKKLVFFLKFLVSASLILFIVLNVEWNEALKNFERASYLLICFAFLSNIAERIFITYKWEILIKAIGISVSFFRLFLINSIGTFWGLFLPSSVGTDVVRGYYLVKNNSKKSVSISSVFVDRILAMFSLLLLGIIAVFISGEILSGYNFDIYIYSLSFISLLLAYLLLKDKTYQFLSKLAAKVKFNKITDLLLKLHQSVLEYKKHKKALLLSFLYNLFVQAARILTFYILSLTFNIHIPIVYFVIYIPIVMIAKMIPVSIGGFGISEGTFIAFFVLVGISINDAVVISFTNTFISTVNTLLGGLAYFFYSKPQKDNLVLKDNHIY